MMCSTKEVKFSADEYGNFEEIQNSSSLLPTIKEQRKSTFFVAFKEIYDEYCINTTIHGIRYIYEHRPLKEKLFWSIIFVISLIFCWNLTSNIYSKWDETPVIVSFSEKSTPIWNIPFPAITICSETKRILKTEGVTFAHFYGNLTENIKMKKKFRPENITKSELDEFRVLLQICNTQIIGDDLPRLSSRRIDYFNILDKMLPEFKRYFYICKWLRHIGDCDKLFSKTYTEEGVCFTFNGLSTKDIYRESTYQYQFQNNMNLTNDNIILKDNLTWSLQNGYEHNTDVKTYPARVLAAGARAGLFIALQNFKHEVDYACRGPIQGFKVLLHSPDDIPHISKEFVRIPMGKEVLIAVKPNMITTSIGIADYEPSRRQCYLNDERLLRYFKIYTQNNCELECLANFTLNRCGCVKFSMPRDVNTPVCTENKIHCYDAAEDELLLREFSEGSKETAFNYRGETTCNCMPACTSLVYNVEISQGSFDLEEMLTAYDDTTYLEEFPGAQMSRLNIYFKENQFITSKRSELYGVTDFLANCGGILGLFVGTSFLSVFELFYYFTIRLWTNVKRKRKE